MIKKRVRNNFLIIIVIVISIYILYKFYQSREQKIEEDGWVNVELHYIGCAKTDYMKENWEVMDDKLWLHQEGELTYTYSEEGGDYEFLNSYSDYQRVNKWYEFYDTDFNPQSALDKSGDVYYVFSPTRRLEWLQYNPNEISEFGGVLNRAGKEWSAEIAEDMVYFYEFEYSGEHHMADVSMEF